MKLNLIYNEQQLILDPFPQTFVDLLALVYNEFSLDCKCHDLILMNIKSGDIINEVAYRTLITNTKDSNSLFLSVTVKEREMKIGFRGICGESEELKLNAIFHALFTLSILNPCFDVSKVLMGDEGQRKKEIDHLGIKKRKRLLKSDKSLLKGQKNFGKIVSASKKERVYKRP